MAKERTYFARFHAACRSGDPKAARDSLLLWLGFYADNQDLTIKDLAEQVQDDDLGEQLRTLQEAVISQPGGWTGEGLYQAVARARRTLLAAQDRSRKGSRQ